MLGHGRLSSSRLTFLLASPAILLTLSGLVLLAVTPFTWGVAAHVGTPDWLITACGLIVALPVIVIGFGSTRLIFTYTRRPFHVFLLHLTFVVVLPVAAAVILFFASRITDPRTYDNLRQDDVQTAPEDVLGGILVMAPFAAGALWAAGYMYAEAFAEERPPPRPADLRWFTDRSACALRVFKDGSTVPVRCVGVKGPG